MQPFNLAEDKLAASTSFHHSYSSIPCTKSSCNKDYSYSEKFMITSYTWLHALDSVMSQLFVVLTFLCSKNYCLSLIMYFLEANFFMRELICFVMPPTNLVILHGVIVRPQTIDLWSVPLLQVSMLRVH